MGNFNRLILPQEVTLPEFPTGLSAYGQSGRAQFRGGTQVGRRWTETYPPMKASDPTVRAFLAQVEFLYAQRSVFMIDHQLLRTLLGLGGGSPVVDTGTAVNIASSNNNTITVTTATSHGLSAGEEVEISGHTRTPDINGTWTVLSAPTLTTFTIAYNGASFVSGGGATGTVIRRATGTSLVTTGWTANRTVLKAGDVFTVAGLSIVFDVTADAVSDGSGRATIGINPPMMSGLSATDGSALTINSTPGAVLFRAVIESRTVPKAPPNTYYGGLSINFREVPA